MAFSRSKDYVSLKEPKPDEDEISDKGKESKRFSLIKKSSTEKGKKKKSLWKSNDTSQICKALMEGQKFIDRHQLTPEPKRREEHYTDSPSIESDFQYEAVDHSYRRNAVCEEKETEREGLYTLLEYRLMKMTLNGGSI